MAKIVKKLSKRNNSATKFWKNKVSEGTVARAEARKEIRKYNKSMKSSAKSLDEVLTARKKRAAAAAKAKKTDSKNLKSINKKPLPARSRSGVASGRGGIRGGLGGGLFGPRVR